MAKDAKFLHVDNDDFDQTARADAEADLSPQMLENIHFFFFVFFFPHFGSLTSGGTTPVS